MRRFAAAFARRDPAPKSQEQPEPVSSLLAPALPAARRSGFFSKAPSQPLEPVLYDGQNFSTPPLTTPTSSASSDASSSMRTPDEGDDFPIPAPTPTIQRTQSRWKTFLRRNKSGTSVSNQPAPNAAQTQLGRTTATAQPTGPQPEHDESLALSDSSANSESDFDDDDSDDEMRYGGGAASTTPTAAASVPSQSRPVPILVDPILAGRSQSNLRAIIEAALEAPPSTPHPLLAPISYAFPRSTNRTNVLAYSPGPASVQAAMHRTRLVQRLDARNLSASEQASILPFRTKSAQQRSSSSRLEQEAVLDQKKLLGWSCGVSEWLKRPAFEQRAVLWTMQEDVITGADVLQSAPIQGTGLAVAELEFSDGLLALASSEATVAAYTLRRPTESAGGVRRNNSIRKSVLNAAAARAKASKANGADGEDDVPLGVMLKLRREQAERKRIREEQQELRRREQEEKLRVLEETKLRNDDRQRKGYAEEVTAARLRRERERQGAGARGNPYEPAERPGSSTRRSSSEPNQGPPPTTPPPSSDARSDKSKRRSVSSTPRQRDDNLKSRDDRSPSAAPLPPRTPPARQSTLPDSRRMSNMSSSTVETTRSKPERRGSTVSEGGRSAHGHDSRTLPRSFRPDSSFMPPPPLPTVRRQSSHSQMPQPQPMPVFVPVFIPQPVPSSWGVDYGQMAAAQTSRSSFYGPHSATGSRVSLPTERPMTVVSSASRSHIQ